MKLIDNGVLVPKRVVLQHWISSPSTPLPAAPRSKGKSGAGPHVRLADADRHCLSNVVIVCAACVGADCVRSSESHPDICLLASASAVGRSAANARVRSCACAVSCPIAKCHGPMCSSATRNFDDFSRELPLDGCHFHRWHEDCSTIAA